MALKRTTIKVVCNEKGCGSFTYMAKVKKWKCPLHSTKEKEVRENDTRKR